MSERLRILDIDPYLAPHEKDLQLRMQLYRQARERLGATKSLSDFANGHHYYGFHQTEDSWLYREWAPNAERIALVGDFNGWNNQKHVMEPIGEGSWELKVPGKIPHGSKVRIQITANGRTFDRIPLYIRRVVQNEDTGAFDGMIWCPEAEYKWHDKKFKLQKPVYIYECHIGMASEEEKVASFNNFRETVLPKIHKLGYTAIQVMAVMEHPYYGSFGYQVSNFFAVSSRFGTPEDLKALVDAAHKLGIGVIMDLVHSHVVKNTVEGISQFDGTDYQFCHTGAIGEHPAWNTRLLNYGKPQVQHFLLSNIKYWLEEYHLDGFRFDGVTSMLYHHHGLGVAFDHYNKYFSMATDTEAVTYLQLAAALVKELRPDSILISEDMSAMPGMCLPIEDGGVGFDYRLNMGLPDYLIKMMKMRDEDWSLSTLWHELVGRRPEEKVIGYTESHDQALVGDKTLMFWLADKEMYWHMRKDDDNLIIDRAMALHKMLRFLTCAVGGDGYLNFMGNEFGHPEWVDFPREGNGWSYYYCRRQWSLADNPELKYQYLKAFDEAMLKFLASPENQGKPVQLLSIQEDCKTIAFIKGSDTFFFNFHPTRSAVHSLGDTSQFEIVFNTAWQRFGSYVDEEKNEGLLRQDGLVCDPRMAIVARYKG